MLENAKKAFKVSKKTGENTFIPKIKSKNILKNISV